MSEFEKQELKLAISGRINSSNVSKIEEELMAGILANHPESIVLDAEDLEYISSAGLRVLLRIKKKCKNLSIINVNSIVYDVFDMTGFTELMNVEKAYRRISVDHCEVIGEGANGIVYRVSPENIVKVYRNQDALPEIQRECDLARKAFVLGVPTAIPFSVVRVGDAYGSMFELLEADSLAERIRKNPACIDECVRIVDRLLKSMHKIEVEAGELPDMREVAIRWAAFVKDYLPADKGERLLAMIKAIPVDYHMMHGDCHIKNIMISHGEPLMIDMDTLCCGHPVFELASIFNAYVGFYELDKNDRSDFLGLLHKTCRVIWKKTLTSYLETEDESYLREVENKVRIIGYTRLIRRNIRRGGLERVDSKALIEYHIHKICSLLETVDSLIF